MAGESQVPEVGERYDRPLDDTADFVQKLIKQCRGDVKKQHKVVREARNFKMGEIWEPEDKQKLNFEGRPVPEINLAKRYLDVTSGLEIINRTQVHFLARVRDKDESQRLSELATGAYRTVLESCMGDFEHSVAFSELLAGGIACCEQRLDDTLSAGGEILAGQNVDILEMFWDTFDHTQNLEKIRFCGRLKVTPKWAAINQWPHEKDYINSVAHDGQLNPLDEPDEVRRVSEFPYNPDNSIKSATKAPKDFVTVIEAFWYEDERYYEFVDPFSHQAQELSEDGFKEFEKNLQEYYPDTKIISVRKRRRVYKRAFVIKNKTMEVSDSPMQTGMPYKFITGDWDPREKVWRGLLYSLMDPERFATKFFSQTMHILAMGGKLTTYYEDGAFENITQAKDEFADFNPFIKVEEGAIANQKFRTDQPIPLPEGMFTLWQACIQLIRDVTGINPDVLGSSSGEVPGVTTRRRMMQGLATVAWYFNAYRRFLLREAPGIMEYIREFYTDDRLIRIGGEFDGSVVQLLRDELTIPWDLIIDDTPESPDIQAERWDGVKDIAVQLFKNGAIAFVPSLIDDMPVRAKTRFEMKQWLKGMAQAMQQAAQNPKQEKGAGKQQDPALVQANVQKRMAEIELTRAKAAAIQQESALDQLKARSEQFTALAGHRRAEREHVMGMRERRNQLTRLNEEHQMDQLSGLTKNLREMAGIGMPEAQA